MLHQRLAAVKASGRSPNLSSMVEIMADTAYTDLRGFDVLPEILKIMKMGTLTDDQQAVVDLMQQWYDDGSRHWIDQHNGLGAYRRDSDGDGLYDYRPQAVLIDAWYPQLIDTGLPQMVAGEAKGASMLDGR